MNSKIYSDFTQQMTAVEHWLEITNDGLDQCPQCTRSMPDFNGEFISRKALSSALCYQATNLSLSTVFLGLALINVNDALIPVGLWIRTSGQKQKLHQFKQLSLCESVTVTSVFHFYCKELTARAKFEDIKYLYI